MTKVIEIVVIGGTGSGKSHVLELIDKALRTEYGHHVQIASHDLSLERGLGNPGEKPRVSETIFNLRERGTASGGGKSSCSLKVEVDTSGVDLALKKIEALGRECLLRNISSGTASVEAAQGFTTGYAVDPLESAIDQAVRLLRDERESEAGQKGIKTVACQRLESHLSELLALQLKQLSEPTVVHHSQVGDVSFTELTSGRGRP